MLDTVEATATDTREAARELSEQEARAALDSIAGKRPTVRDLASAWGWSKSRAGRFIESYDAAKRGTNGTAAPVSQSGGTFDVQPYVDQCLGAIARGKQERQDRAAEIDERNGEQTLVVAQREITIQRDEEVGQWILKQKNWPDDDAEIIINDEAMTDFLASLHHAFGR